MFNSFFPRFRIYFHKFICIRYIFNNSFRLEDIISYKHVQYCKKFQVPGTNQLKCPTCGSTLVIETDELSMLDMENDTSKDLLKSVTKNQHSENPVKTNLQHSESSSSIGKSHSDLRM